jgi:hypothetical protein
MSWSTARGFVMSRGISTFVPLTFCRRLHGCLSYRYRLYNPGQFRHGDLVEMTFTCVAIPVKGGKYKMMQALKGIVLLERGPHLQVCVFPHHNLRLLTVISRAALWTWPGPQDKYAKLSVNPFTLRTIWEWRWRVLGGSFPVCTLTDKRSPFTSFVLIRR